MNSQEFRMLLAAAYPELSAEVADRLNRFRELVVEENSRQNLTRLVEPRDFLEGHVMDSVQLLESKLLEFPTMDLGSGVGVPGIPCAILGSGPWLLAESEGMKADFLSRAVRQLGLDSVRVYSGRGEKVLERERVGSIVARAVGPIGRIYGWLRDCSTWNSLVLLKGPGWDEEWKEFSRSSAGKKLKIEGTHSYEVGPEKKKRVIIRLVPRGTK